MIVNLYGVFRMIFAALNVSFGGVAGFVRPVIMPMVMGTVDEKQSKAEEVRDYEEQMKGITSAMENICWFFGQVLFIGGAGGLLVQSTLKDLSYDVSLLSLAMVEVPVALVALVVSFIYFSIKDKKLRAKDHIVAPKEDKA